MKQAGILTSTRGSLSLIPDLSNLSSLIKSSSRLNSLHPSSKSAERTPTATPTAFYCLSSRQSSQESTLIKNSLKNLINHEESPSKTPIISNINPSQRLSKRKPLGKSSTQVKAPSPVETILKPKMQTHLKLTKLNEILDDNLKILTNHFEIKSKSWLENLVMVKNFKSQDFEENLNFCNKIFRDFLLRLKQSGKENEASLIEKIWRLNYENFDLFFDKFQMKIKDLESELLRKKLEIQMVHQEFSQKETEILKKFKEVKENNEEISEKLIICQKKNDDFQSRMLRKAKFEGGEWCLEKLDAVEPIIARIGEKLQNLECIFVRSAKTRRFCKDDFLFQVDHKVKNKKSFDLVRPDFKDLLNFNNFY